MFSEAESLYLEEVLGLDPRRLACQLRPAKGLEFLVVIKVLPLKDAVERELLEKILKSIAQDSAPVWETDQGSSVLPLASHTLSFCCETEPYKEVLADGVEPRMIWNLPTIQSMTGSHPSVAEKKKKTWALLKAFQMEFES